MALLYKLHTRDDLAFELGIPLKKLTHILYGKHTEKCYFSFSVPKRSGGQRLICAPIEDLKSVQKRLARLFQDKRIEMSKTCECPRVLSHGFERKKDIFTNAKIHRNKRFVLNLDLEDFFGSVHFGRIVGYLEKNKSFLLSHEVAVAIAQLCCYQGKLPQGAPTSPVLANMVCDVLDYRLLKIAKKYRVDYTRYADDLSFSTNDPKFLENYDAFYHEVAGTIKRAGFMVNEKKTRLQYRDSRQTVTGLVVNKIINIDRRYYKDTRAMADRLYKTGAFKIDGADGTIAQLEGRFAFMHRCDRLNSDHLEEKKSSAYLTSRERQYQKFLFYKTFYAHDIPLLVMEGPTDIRYIKAALMNMHERYPKLVQKNPDSSFKFKIRFFRRTERWKYLFDINEGADSMRNIYEFYVGDKGRPAYFEQFKKIRISEQMRPVILVFDNELQNNNKPLCKFVNGARKSKDIRKSISDSCHAHLLDDGYLHLVTHPLVGDVKEGEIESLFDDATRKLVLGGKTLTLSGSFDTSKHYGKDIFSQHIISNYESIDFSGFCPMLDQINAIIMDCESASNNSTPDSSTVATS